MGESEPRTEGWSVRLTGLHQAVVGHVRATLGLLMGAVVPVLLIACANAAGLFLARAASRRNGVRIHKAPGGSAVQVARRSLAETGLVAVAAGVLGTALAVGAVRLVDGGGLAFALAVSVATGLIFGLGRSGGPGPHGGSSVGDDTSGIGDAGAPGRTHRAGGGAAGGVNESG